MCIRDRIKNAGSMPQCRPRLEEVHREVRQFGITVPGEVEHVSQRARTLHEAGHWLVLTVCSNASNTIRRTSMHAEMAKCGPVLMRLVEKYHGTRPAHVFFWMDCGETRTVACSSGVHEFRIVLSGVATRAEAFPGGVGGRRSRSLRIHERYLSRPYGGHGKHS